ncbi:hypothetical protein L873DRAFT_1788302 [Choiromyces venosus 120613-1]|uniref:Uncharacterized protein n=1 Tax=Choiromyces venosus 120613-1 TaxID=1336337 RepID=A0A3N4K658_9PEZI|nr:hypothetical protein L873DRAFT_1788302 [Choiromyces venosus 120613-1]
MSRLYNEPWTGTKWCTIPSLQSSLYIHGDGQRVWFGGVVELHFSALHIPPTLTVFGTVCGQVEVIQDSIVTIHLKVLPLKQINYHVFLAPINTESLHQPDLPLYSSKLLIQCYQPTNIYLPPHKCVTIACLSANNSITPTPEVNPTAQFELITNDELAQLFPVPASKLIQQVIGSNIPLQLVNIALWQDGMSGNQTKKWNPHEVILLSFPGLHNQNENQKGKNGLRILSVAKDISGVSLLDPMMNETKQLQRGIIGYDANNKNSVIITGSLLMIKGDNPASSTLANH